MRRREWLLTSLGAVAMGSGGLLWSRMECNWLQPEYLTIPMAGLTQPITVAQLTDIHWDHGETVSWSLIMEAIQQINRASVDLIALTGDFVTHSPKPIFELAPALGELRSNHGIFAVLGNHDNALAESRRTITQALQKANITVLENRWTTTTANLILAGTGDFWHGPYAPQRALAHIPAHLPRLLLAHNPDGFWKLKDHRIDLQLSGHTHGGQVRIGSWTPLSFYDLLDPLLEDFNTQALEKIAPGRHIISSGSWAGLYRQGTNQLYVSRGMGRFRQLSLGCPPEVTFLKLVPQGS